jgi:hypothetical protein
LGQPPSDEDKKKWKQARRLIDTVLERATAYPEIWRVRADITDVTPAGLITDPAEQQREMETARSDRKLYAAAMATAPVLAAAQSSRTKAALEKFVGDDANLQPGRQIWARRAGDTGPETLALTATAVVVDENNTTRLLLPDFALLGTVNDVTEYRLSPNGRVIARGQGTDLVYPPGRAQDVGNGLLLARIEENVSHSNKIVATERVLSDVAPLPAPGTAVTLFGIGRARSAQVNSIDGLFATTESITRPGEAGAPLLDEAGKLVAIGHSSGYDGSKFLSVGWLFDQQRLMLAR